MFHIGFGTYTAWHIWGVAHIGSGIYGGKVPLMHESCLLSFWGCITYTAQREIFLVIGRSAVRLFFSCTFTGVYCETLSKFMSLSTVKNSIRNQKGLCDNRIFVTYCNSPSVPFQPSLVNLIDNVKKLYHFLVFINSRRTNFLKRSATQLI